MTAAVFSGNIATVTLVPAFAFGVLVPASALGVLVEPFDTCC